MTLDPYFAEKMKVLSDFPSVDEAMKDPASAAKLQSAFQDEQVLEVPQGDVNDELVETSAGPIRLRLYRPASEAISAGFVWAHGGGFAGGDIDKPEADTVARELAFVHGVAVISVDYSLANGGSVIYPTLHHQITDAFRWTRANAGRLGIDPKRLGIGGASAGATLALSAIFELRRTGEALPTSLVLAYPLLYRTLMMNAPLDRELTKAMGPLRMTQSVVDHMFSLYTGTTAAPLASVEGNQLEGLPRTLLQISEYDDLRPQAETFSREATALGVEVEEYLALGMPHGHLDRTRAVPEVTRTVDVIASFLTR